MYIKPDYQSLNDLINDSKVPLEVKEGELILEISKREQNNKARICLPYILIITENGKIIGDEVVGYFKNPLEYLFSTMGFEGIVPEIIRVLEGRPKYDGGTFGGGCFIP